MDYVLFGLDNYKLSCISSSITNAAQPGLKKSGVTMMLRLFY
jgi:hypothetical protein